MSAFKVGDVCIIVKNCLPSTRHLNGHECQIVGLGSVGCHDSFFMCRYDCHVEVDCGGVYCCAFACLRKKPGHDDTNAVVDWRSCVWRPPHLRTPVRHSVTYEVVE